MTSAVPVEWALWGKPPGSHSDYGIVRSSVAYSSHPALAGLINPLLPGSPEYVVAEGGAGTVPGLPWVSFGGEQEDADGRTGYGICVTTKTPHVDGAGRRLSQSLYFRFPAATVRARGADFTTLWRAVSSATIPGSSEPLKLRLDPASRERTAARIAATGRLDWCAVAAAALLERPVAITGANGSLTTDQAVELLDMVVCLLPAGLRPTVTAATGVDGLAAHDMRLVFAPYPTSRATEIPYDPAASGPAAQRLGEAGTAYLRQLMLLFDEVGRSAPAVLGVLRDLDEPHDLGSSAGGAEWAETALRRRDLARSVLTDLADFPDLALRHRAQASTPQVADFHREVRELLDNPSLSDDARTVLYRYVVEGPFPRLMPAEQWDQALDTIVETVCRISSGASGSDPESDSPVPALLSEMPPALRDLLLCQVIEICGRQPTTWNAEPPCSIVKRLADWIVAADPGPPDVRWAERFPLTRDAVATRPDLAMRLVAANKDSAPVLKRLCWMLASASQAQPWLRQVAKTLTDPDDAPARKLSDDIAAADVEAPGTAEAILVGAWTLGRARSVIPMVWPALVAAVLSGPPRAELTRRTVKDLLANRMEHGATQEVDARLDGLALLLGESPVHLTLSGHVQESALSTAYVAAIAETWRDTPNTVAGRLLAAIIVEAVPIAPDALAQLIGVCADQPPDEVLDVILGLRNADPDALNTVPDRFWTALGSRRRDLTDRHWAGALRDATDLQTVASIWPRAIDGGLTPAELLRGLGPWPRTGPILTLWTRIFPRSRPSAKWSADVEELVLTVQWPDSWSARRVIEGRAEMRRLLAEGVWGTRRAAILRAFWDSSPAESAD